MTLQDAIKAQEQNYQRLFSAAKAVSDGVEVGLDDVNGKSVEVLEVPADKLKEVVGQEADATCMMYEGRYVIFVCETPAEPPKYLSIRGFWLRRHVVLHEYGHIRNGDVFEDNPPQVYAFVMGLRSGDPKADDHYQKIELAADGYAAQRLIVEAKQAGRNDVADDLEKLTKDNNLPSPGI